MIKCGDCNKEMVAIGEEVMPITLESIYIYACPKCKTSLRYMGKPEESKKPKRPWRIA